MGGSSSVSGVTTRVAPTSSACWRRTAEGSLTVMSEIPWARSTATMQQPDRTGPGDEHAIVRADVGQPHCVQRDGRRLGQRGHPGRQRIGNPDQAVGRHRLVLAEGTPVPAEVRRGTVQAHRRAAPSAGPAHAAPRGRIAHDSVAGRPAGAARRGGHDARPLVAENGTRFGVPLQDHVQIGSADAALGNLDEHLAGSRLRTGDLLDGDPAVAHVDGCGHQW